MLCVTALLASTLGAYQQYNVSQIAALSRAIMAGNTSGPLPFRAASDQCTTYSAKKVAIRVPGDDGRTVFDTTDNYLLHAGSLSFETRDHLITNHLAECPSTFPSDQTTLLIDDECYDNLFSYTYSLSNIETLFVLGQPENTGSRPSLLGPSSNVHVITTTYDLGSEGLVTYYPYCVDELDLQVQKRDIDDLYTEMVTFLKGFRVSQATSFTDYANAPGSTLNSGWENTQPCLQIVDTIMNLLGAVHHTDQFTLETLIDAQLDLIQHRYTNMGLDDDYYDVSYNVYNDDDTEGHTENVGRYKDQIDSFVTALTSLRDIFLWKQCVEFLDTYRLFYLTTSEYQSAFDPMSPLTFVELASKKNMHPQEFKMPDRIYELAWSMDMSTHLVDQRIVTCMHSTPDQYSSAYNRQIVQKLAPSRKGDKSYCESGILAGTNGIDSNWASEEGSLLYNPFNPSVTSAGVVRLPVQASKYYFFEFFDHTHIRFDLGVTCAITATGTCSNSDPAPVDGNNQPIREDTEYFEDTTTTMTFRFKRIPTSGAFFFNMDEEGLWYTPDVAGTMRFNSEDIQEILVYTPGNGNFENLYFNNANFNMNLDNEIGLSGLHSQFTNADFLESTIDWIAMRDTVSEDIVRANMMRLIWPPSLVFDTSLIRSGNNWYPETLAQQEQEEAQYLNACDTIGKTKYKLEVNIDNLRKALEDKDSLSDVPNEDIEEELRNTKLKLGQLDDEFSDACLTEIEEELTISDTDSNTLPTDECYDEEYANQLEICKNLINDQLSIGGDNDAKVAVFEERCYNDRTVCGDDCNYDTVFKKTIGDCNTKPIDIIRGDYSLTVYPSKDFIAGCQRQEVYLQWVTTNDVVAIAEDQKDNDNLVRAQEKEVLNKVVLAQAKATSTGIDGVKEMIEIAATEKAPSITKSVSIVKASLYHYDSSNVQTPKELQVSISLTGLKTADMAQTDVEIDYAKTPVQRRNSDDETPEVVLKDDTRVLATTCGQSQIDTYTASVSLDTNGKCNNATGQPTTPGVFSSRQLRSVSSTTTNTTNTTDTSDEQHNNDDNSDDDDKLSDGAIAGIVIGSVAGVAAIGYVGYRVSKRQGTASTYNVLQNSL